MCHHTQEPTVLSTVSCSFSLNVDRFHQPCLLPWSIPVVELKATGQGQARTVILVPRGGHLSVLQAAGSSSMCLTGGFYHVTGPYHGSTFNRPSPSLRRHSLRYGVCTLRRFGTLTGTATACPLTMSSLGFVFGICFVFSLCFSFARSSYCRSVLVSISRFEMGFLDFLLEIPVGHELQSTIVVFLVTE